MSYLYTHIHDTYINTCTTRVIENGARHEIHIYMHTLYMHAYIHNKGHQKQCKSGNLRASVCMYICMVCVRLYMHTYKYARRHTYTYTHAHRYRSTYIQTAYIHIHMHRPRAYVHMHIPTWPASHTTSAYPRYNTYMPEYIHTHMHTYMHA